MVMMALMFVLPIAFILWMNRSQSKKQQSLEQSLAVGDRVVTQAGLFGKLTELGEKRAKLEIAPGVTVQVLKGSIASKDAT